MLKELGIGIVVGAVIFGTALLIVAKISPDGKDQQEDAFRFHLTGDERRAALEMIAASDACLQAMEQLDLPKDQAFQFRNGSEATRGEIAARLKAAIGTLGREMKEPGGAR